MTMYITETPRERAMAKWIFVGFMYYPVYICFAVYFLSEINYKHYFNSDITKIFGFSIIIFNMAYLLMLTLIILYNYFSRDGHASIQPFNKIIIIFGSISLLFAIAQKITPSEYIYLTVMCFINVIIAIASCYWHHIILKWYPEDNNYEQI